MVISMNRLNLLKKHVKDLERDVNEDKEILYEIASSWPNAIIAVYDRDRFNVNETPSEGQLP